MRVFVTGGNGFIGSAVVRELVRRGHGVRCLLRPSSRTDRLDGLDYERAIGDVRDSASLEPAVEGSDAVVHLAGVSSWNDIESPLMEEVVVGGTENVLRAARNTSVQRLVVVSSSIAVNGTPRPLVQDEASPFELDVSRPGFRYARAKRQVETLCQAAAAEGVPVTVVNPCEVYGPRDVDLITSGNLLDFIKSWPALVCSGGTSVVHVDDVAAGIASALERGRPGARYILGGDNLTIRELAALTLELAGRKKPILTMPNWLIRGLAKLGSRLRVPLPFNPAVIPYATLYWFMDNARARTELGVTFRDARATLSPTLAWLQAAGHIQ